MKYASILAKRKIKKRLGKKVAKNVHAAASKLGRMGGLIGGVARAEILDSDRLSDIALHAANMRWGNKCTCSVCAQA